MDYKIKLFKGKCPGLNSRLTYLDLIVYKRDNESCVAINISPLITLSQNIIIGLYIPNERLNSTYNCKFVKPVDFKRGYTQKGFYKKHDHFPTEVDLNDSIKDIAYISTVLSYVYIIPLDEASIYEWIVSCIDTWLFNYD